ncbi:hypothetical protein ABIF65_009127 [Bradyrhizobium japonicum]|uniref:hypothetical protein n=3 Tax=Nitrobacteraceae TaxID=41294 RepID=UPI00209FFEA7|nr:hypothetical protein [Bradyrhizobium japonicum]WLB97373.1 hypothetical protein QIH92_49265 [Bradyrhizobium japonicum USDA 123]MCP1747204.1 hypothetical protein [Bradyrhizobium japonicum]MCP1774684.1 hypothetical protein [Bradyrhizobium japonicum]MCP1865538.1 hypothetical protein [Bradyrhizobium japonicum]MCP1895691.1 hypothetical protein [Bradyrhizobium japonicum]
MMDVNDIDNALHEIRQMVLVAIGAHESLLGGDPDPEVFSMPRRDAEMLSFSIFDVLKRVEDLKEKLTEPARPQAKIVLIGGNECA